MSNKNKIRLLIILTAALLLLLALLFGLRRASEEAPNVQPDDPGVPTQGNPTEEIEAPELDDFLNGRDPATFTWEEYIRLTPQQQAQFPDYFESMDAFNLWYDSVYENAGENAETIPVDKEFLDGREPSEFTWEEYQQLTPEQQAMFPDCFESLDAFNYWYNNVEKNTDQEEDEMITDDDYLNGRDPSEFTWEEYQQLSPEQQAMFPDYFESLDAFNSWYDAAKKDAEGEDDTVDSTQEPAIEDTTEEPGLPDMDDFLNGRDPATFTWEEYQSLTPEQQAMFPDYFESYDAFLKWKNNVEP